MSTTLNNQIPTCLYHEQAARWCVHWGFSGEEIVNLERNECFTHAPSNLSLAKYKKNFGKCARNAQTDKGNFEEKLSD